MFTVKTILDEKGHDVWTISPEAKVIDALKLMADKNIGALVVLFKNKVTGIFSERDYARKVVLLGKSSVDTPVKEIMTFKVYSVSPETPVEECMTLMTQKRVRHVPVVESGKLVGLITSGDVVRAVMLKQSNTLESLQNYIKGKYV